MQANQSVRVLRLVQRVQPFNVRVPLIQPHRAIAVRHVEARIFQHFQRKTGFPISTIEMNAALRVLCQIRNRQVAKLKLAGGFFARKNQRLEIFAGVEPDRCLL